MQRVLCLLLVVAATCGGPAPLGVPPVPASLILPSVDTQLSESYPAVNLRGSGTIYVGAFDLGESLGTVEVLGRRLPAIVISSGYMISRAGDELLLLHEIYALDNDRFVLIWTYCRGGVINQIYLEDFRGEFNRFDEASGTCEDVPRTSPLQARLPATEMAWPQVFTGFEVSGDSVQLRPGTPGAVRYDGTVEAVFTFAVIDCSYCLPSSGWYELHALLWNPVTRNSSIGIFYLDPRDPDHVSLSYVFDLANLTPLPDATYRADWSFTGVVPLRE
ncbi:MAG TPA: hypothetical protein VE964_04630 [Myxococcales bacterium]|nr:hypothetical protein [Myxococcales bacterium]